MSAERRRLVGKIFAVYKETGKTSHDIVDELRRLTGEKKVGHAGTLDPLAEGVLVVGVGRTATKKLARITEHEKEYLAEIILGKYSTTDDNEGEKQNVKVTEIPDENTIRSTLRTFQGKIKQKPPRFSAVRLAGKRAYKLAREKKHFRLPERDVFIKEIHLLGYNWPIIKIRLVTGPGVYVRSLARDVGRKLHTGGYLQSLRRTRVGEYKKENALTISGLRENQQLKS